MDYKNLPQKAGGGPGIDVLGVSFYARYCS